MRLAIPVLAIALLGACDRQKASDLQGNDTAAAPLPGKGVDRSRAGTAAPDVEFRDPEGEPITLARFAGKPLLLNLWATWCAPCVKELPTLDRLAGTDQAITVVTLSQDSSDQEKVRAFLDERKLARLEAWHDPEMAMSTGLNVQTLPTTILIDSSGRELWRYAGDLDWTGAEAKKLLAEAK